MTDVSPLYHAVLAVTAQIIVALTCWPLIGPGLGAVIGGVLAVGFYWGREVAQAERHTAETAWWRGFDVRLWSMDARLDLLCPALACLVLGVFIMYGVQDVCDVGR